MSEPNWVALGVQGGSVDYEGAWSAGTAYVPGDVVRYNGVEYLAVNPSTGQTPPLATVEIGVSLPASPVDGTEYILVDSLTAPTYSWRFRYTASVTDAYKWVFVGGVPSLTEVATQESTASGANVDLTTPGPSFTIPRAGDYLIGMGCRVFVASAITQGTMTLYRDAVATALSAAFLIWPSAAPTQVIASVAGEKKISGLTVGNVMRAKYNSSNGTSAVNYGDRWLRVTPVRVT